MEKLWEKRIAKSLETDRVICAGALPQGLQAAAGMGDKLQKGEQEGQGVSSLRRTHPCTPSGPSQAPEHPKANGSLAVSEPLEPARGAE